MNYDALKIWIDVAQFAVTGGIAVWLWLVERGDKTNSRVSRLEEVTDRRLDDHGTRLSMLEGRLGGVPTHEDLAALHERINDVVKLQERVNGEFQGVKNVLNMIHQHLLTGGGKS